MTERRLFTIAEIAAFVADTEDNIQGFIRDERIPYIATPEGVSIPIGGFQICMPDLYDLRMPECPPSDDGLHCEHWYDGDACHDCGAPEMTMEQKVEQGMCEGPIRRPDVQ